MGDTKILKTLQVDLKDRSYPIHIGSGHLEKLDINSHVKGERVLVVTNDTIAPLYLDRVKALFDGKQVDTIVLPDGEQFKNLEHLDFIFTKLLKKKHDRKTTLVALGGGVIGDMTGFAAASYQRGVSFIQIPTTLLAQVDSSVGGKTGVNHVLGKNMVGAFHQPSAVLIDINLLETLPSREFSAGMAEVIKYGLIADSDFLEWIEENSELLIDRDDLTLATAIERSCAIKAKIVSADETEQGMRALLNFGHTFGHAIETFQNYRGYLHGEAISAGMVMAAKLSVAEGDLSDADLGRVRHLCGRFSLPIAPPLAMSADDFIELMYRDKKVLNGKLRLVLLNQLGDACVEDNFSQKALQAILKDSCQS
jgi:3-dehydroquinate synthase